ncbi:hypothetical protein LguiA_026907 [Lonicera macranthoides]
MRYSQPALSSSPSGPSPGYYNLSVMDVEDYFVEGHRHGEEKNRRNTTASTSTHALHYDGK